MNGALSLAIAVAGAPLAAQSTADPARPSDPTMAATGSATAATGTDDALAQPVAPVKTGIDGPDSDNRPLADNEVAFTADQIDYDYKAKLVTATGDVRMIRQGSHLRADKVVWDRNTGKATATGNVAIRNPQGDTSYADTLDLNDDLKDGIAQNLLLVLENGGRMAATRGERKEGVYYLDHAAYSPCDVTTDLGCPKRPLWEITAEKVVYDPQRHRLSYRDARLRFFGMPLFWLPAFSHPDGTGQGGSSGLLVPDATYNSRNGMMVSTPYYWQIAPNRDATITPYVFSAVDPMIEAQYRSLDRNGAFQIHGFATRSSQSSNNTSTGTEEFRGYIEANGRYQFGPDWTVSASLRDATDKTFLRRYDISDDDRLRSVIKAERIDDQSYLQISGWYFRTLVLGQDQKQQPIALPLIDYRRRVVDPWLGGAFTFQVNTLAIERQVGQDTQRAFVAAQWQKWTLLPTGQMLTFTAYGRGDLYHTADTDETTTPVYRGLAGWQTRGIVAGAIDMRWPFVGEFLGGTQIITPHIQFAASPHTRNLDIPNEDARAIDLEDSNLFALNRFNGYDRWEGDTRVTYGVEYSLDLPRFALSSILGQSYRLAGGAGLFPNGTGLSSPTSDIVGRTTVRYASFVSITDRYRFDKDNLAVRSNEVDATIGTSKTYLLLGYLDLDRHISPTVEDLQDHQEVRFGGRVAFLRRWSLFGSATLDLTNAKDETNFLSSTANGFDPVQSRVGAAYEDNCLRASLQWHRDFAAFGDARRGSSILFQLAFKNLGR